MLLFFAHATLAVLQSLDYVVATAGTMGIRLHMALTNNWHDYGGREQVRGSLLRQHRNQMNYSTQLTNESHQVTTCGAWKVDHNHSTYAKGTQEQHCNHLSLHHMQHAGVP